MASSALQRWVNPQGGGLNRFLVACTALGFLALIAAGGAAAWMTTRYQEHAAWVAHTYEVEAAIARANIALERSEAARRGYLLTADPAFATRYQQAVAGLTPNILRFSFLTADNPDQQARLPRLNRLLTTLKQEREAGNALVASGRRDEAVRSFAGENTTVTIRALRRLLATAAADERQLLKIRDLDQRSALRTFYIILALAGILLAVVAVLSLLTILSYTRDLAASHARLRELNESLEDAVQERTSELRRANEEIQRFAYIVSHDLRSPLVNVMGFTAELSAATAPLAQLVERAEAAAPDIVTDEARHAARTDLPEAIGFIRTSTQKMDRLINAILKLSREGRRTIAPERLDIAAIADTAVAAIRQVIDARGVTVTIERPMPALTSDRLAVEQILSNLIENATKYLHPGRPGEITVSASEARGRVIIAVADNGRGIDPRDHQRIFDLFRRSGQQDQPGEGIGLAHVRALAYRLGGTIDVQSSLGEGATFRLNLPLVYQAPQEATA